MATFEQLQEVRDLLEKSLAVINDAREAKTYTTDDWVAIRTKTFEMKEPLPDDQKKLAQDIARAYNNVRNMIWLQYKTDFDYREQS